jgi:putative ABC transport system permease protein
MPLALRILIDTPGRLIVSVAGIILAVVLMFSQAGFRNGMFDSQTQLIHRLEADLFLVGSLQYILYVPEPFPSRRLYQAQAVEGVRAVYPIYIESIMSNPDCVWSNPHDNSSRPIRVLAFDPEAPVFGSPEVRAHAAQLKRPDTVLFDARSRDYYGRPQAGDQAELAGHTVWVVGTFRMGTDFANDGNLIMSDWNFFRLFPDRTATAPHPAKVYIGVVHLQPGADLRAVQRRLREALPADVAVLTKPEMLARETRHWQENTAIGYIFTLGMTVGFMVGIIICYQILYTIVGNYLPQFATLKAMGYTDRYLMGVVMQQGIFLALLGFLPAIVLAQLLFKVVGQLTGLLLYLTPLRIAFILVLTVAMCMVSGAIAVRRIFTADPAEVFK